MEMMEQIQMANGTHKKIPAKKCKISVESLTDKKLSKGAQTRNEAIEPENQTPGVIARLMGLDKLPTDFRGSRSSSAEFKADHISVHSTTCKSILERQHHEYEYENLHRHSNSEDEKVKLHFRNNPQEQQLQEFGMSQIKRKQGHSRSSSKLQEPEFSESEELVDAIKFLQSNKETFMRFLQGSNISSVDKDIEKNVASFCFPSHKIEDVKQWNAYQELHFIKPQTTNRSHKKNGSGFGTNAVGTSRVPTFGGIESSERWHYHGEYLMNSERNLHNNFDFNIFSQGEYLMDPEKNLNKTHNNFPSRIVVLKPNTGRVLNSKSVLVEFPDDYKKVREGDKNIDQDFNGLLLKNGTKDLYKSDSTVAADTCNYENSLNSPRQIGKDTAKHVRKTFFRDFMATYKHMYPTTSDPDLLGVVSKFKKGSDYKMDNPTVDCSDLDFKEGKPKKEFRITILRPTGLVQKPPNSGWGEATKKSERTLFEMKKQVTNQALCQFNIDFDSIGVDIPNTVSHIKSQKHVHVSKNQASFESSLISANDILKKGVNGCHKKEQSEHSPISVLNEHFVEEYIEFKGKCLDPQYELPLQPHQEEEEEEAFQGSSFENFMDIPRFEPAIDVKHLDHVKNSEILYVKNVLTASGLMRDDDILHRIHSLSQPLDPSLFQMVDMRYLSKQSRLGTLKSLSQRQLLFDSLNEILCDLLGFPVHCCHRMLTSQCLLPSRESLVNHVLTTVACPFETVENLVAKHVIRDKWLEPNMGIEALGDHMERHILDDLIEETTILLFSSK